MKTLYAETKKISVIRGAKRSPCRLDAHNNQICPDDIQRDFATEFLRNILK